MSQPIRKRILVVDDEESLARILKLNLESNGGYEVRVENDGRRAIEAAREFRPDLILLDVIMPDVDGGQVAAELKEIPQLRSVPVVFLTAVVSKDEVRSHGDHIGGRTFLAKPASIREVLEVIEKTLAA